MCTLLCTCFQLFTCPYHAASQIYLTLFCCFVFHFILENENFYFLTSFWPNLWPILINCVCVGVFECVFVFLALQAFELCPLCGSIHSRSKTGCSSNIHWRSLYFYFSAFITCLQMHWSFMFGCLIMASKWVKMVYSFLFVVSKTKPQTVGP